MRNRIAVVGIMSAGRAAPVERFKDGMRLHGFIEGRNVMFHARVAHGDATRLAGFARELVGIGVDLIAAIGAVTARAARSASDQMPIVYSVVVNPAGDGLASPSGDPLPNMTGVTTFDDGQAQVQVALLRAIEPGLARIAYLADAAVSDCLASSNIVAARAAGLHPIVVHLGGPAPALEAAFAIIQDERAQAILALEHPVLGVHAAEIAERAQANHLPTVFPLEQAGEGGLLSYGTSLGQAALRMARPASRLLNGEAAIDLPIETHRCPDLIIDMRTARRLGLGIPSEILRKAIRVIQ